MHDIEPHYHWRHLYMAEEDPRSIFLGVLIASLNFLKPCIIIIYIRSGMNSVVKLYI